MKKLFINLIKLSALLFVAGFIFFLNANSASAACALTTAGTWDGDVNTDATAGNSGTARWTGCTGGVGKTPSTGDTISLTTTQTLQITASATVSAFEFSATSTAGVLQVDSPATLTVTNAVTVRTAAGANTAGTVQGTGIISAASIAVGDGTSVTTNSVETATLTSTIATFTLSAGITYTAFDGTSNRDCNPVLNLNSGTLNVGTGINMGSVNVAGVKFVMGNSSPTLKISGATPWTTPGSSVVTTLNGTGATVEYAASAAPVRVTSYNNLTLSGGGTATGAVTTVAGTLTMSGNTVWTADTLTSTIGAITLSGTASLTLGADMSATGVSGNLTIGSGTTFKPSSRNMTIQGTTDISGTFNDDSVTGTNIFVGAVTVNNGGTWTETNNPAFTFRGGLTVNSTSTFTSGTGTYTFDTNAQTIGGTQSYTITNLTNNVTSGTGLTFSGAQPTITTLTQGTNGYLTLSGTLPTFTNFTPSASGNTVDYSGTTQTCIVTTYVNLKLSGSTSTDTCAPTDVTGTMTVSGGISWTVPAAGWTMSGGLTLNTTGTVTGNTSGTFTIANTSGSFTITTGTYNVGAGSIFVTGTTSVTGTLNDTSTSGNTIFSGAVTVNSGGTWGNNSAGDDYYFRGGLTVNSGSTFTAGNGTYNFEINAQTVSGTATYTLTNVTNAITSGTGLTFSGAQPTVTTLTQNANTVLTFTGSTPTITTLDATQSGNTVVYDPTTNGSSITVISGSYVNLTLDNTNDSTNSANTFTLGGDTTVSGQVKVGHSSSTNADTFSISTFTLTLSGSGATTSQPLCINNTDCANSVQGAVTFSSGTVKYTGATATNVALRNGLNTGVSYKNLEISPSGTVTHTLGSASSLALTVTGNLTLGNGSNSGTITASTNNPTINIGGNMTINANTTYTKGTGTTTFNGTIAATYTDNTATPQNLGVVSLNKTNTSSPSTNDKLTLASSMTVDTLTINGTSGQADTFNAGSGGYTLKIANAGATATVFTTNSGGFGTFTAGNSTVEYTATNSGGNITIDSLTFYNLTLTGTETYVTSAPTISNNLLVNTNAILTHSSTLTVDGDFTGAGTVSDGNSSGNETHLVCAKSICMFGPTGNNDWTFDTPVFFTADSLGASSTVRTTSGGSGKIVAIQGFWLGNELSCGGNITYSTTFDNETNDRVIDIDGDFYISEYACGTGTFQASSTASFTVGGDWLNYDVGVFTANSGTVTFDAGDSGNTLDGNMTGTTKFNNVVFNNAAGSWSFSKSADVGGNFTVTAGAVTAPAGTLAIGGNFTNTPGTTTSFAQNSGTVQFGSSNNFQALSQTSRFWDGMAAAPNGNVYADVDGGDIYMQTAGTGNFVALGQTSRAWGGMAAAPNGNVYASVWNSGDIYMQTAGTGNFVALGQTSRHWTGMAAAPNGNIYASTDGGDIYMQTAGTGNFVALGQTSRNWRGMAVAPNGNVYAAVNNNDNTGDVYMQTAGTGNFVALGQTGRNWGVMSADSSGNIYASVNSGDIYMQTAGTGSFVALGVFNHSWGAMTAASNGNVYLADYCSDPTCVIGGDIYRNNFTLSSSTSTISGTTTFNNLKVTLADKAVHFTAGTTYTTNGLLTLTGTSGHNVLLNSDTGSSDWTINHQGTESVTYTTVTHSACDAGSTAISVSTGATNGGNNGTCWNFGTSITISGNVYQDEAGSPTNWSSCDNSTTNIGISVNGSAISPIVCNAGAFSTTATVTANNIVAIWLHSVGSNYGVTYTKVAGTPANLTGLVLTKNRITLAADFTNANINTYDKSNDADIPVASDGTNITGDSGVKLVVPTGKAFTPGGSITVDSFESNGNTQVTSQTVTITGSGTSTDCTADIGTMLPLCVTGTFNPTGTTFNFTGTADTKIQSSVSYPTLNLGTTANSSNVTYTLTQNQTITGVLTVGATSGTGVHTLDLGSNTLTLSGTSTPLVINSQGALTASTSTVQYTGTTATVTGTTFNNLTLGGTGTYTLPASNVTLRGDLVVTTGATVTKSATNEIVFAKGGTQTITGNAVNSDLGFIRISSNTTNTTLNMSSSITMTRLIIDDLSQNFSTGSNTLTLTDSTAGISGSCLSNIDFSTNSTVIYTGNGTSITTACTYYNLKLQPSGSSQQVLNSSTLNVNGDLTVGDATNQGATAVTHNTVINVTGNTTIASGATLTSGNGNFNFSGDVTVSGTLTTGGVNTTTVNGNITGSGTVSFNEGTLEQRTTSNKTFGSTGGSNDWEFRNLKFSNGNGGSTPVTITFNSGGTGAIRSLVTTTIGGASDASGATTTLDASSRTFEIGYYSLEGGVQASSSTLTITSSKGVLTPNTSTINFIADTSPTIPAATYYNLGAGTFSDTGTGATFTLGGNVTVSNTLTIGNTGSTNTDALDLSSYTLTLSASGTPLSITSKGDLSPSTGTVNYTGTSATNVTAETYYNLGAGTTANSSSVTYTLAGNTTASGVLTVGASSGSGTHTLDASSRTLTLSGSGTPFVVNSQGAFTASTSTVNYTGTSATNITVLSYKNLGIGTTSDSSAVTYTLLGDTTVSGAVTLGNSGSTGTDILDPTSSYTLTLSGTGTPVTATSNGTFSTSGTVQYTAATATLTGTTYNNITLGGTGTYTLPAADVTLRGNLVVTTDAAVTKSASNTIIFAKGGGGTQTLTSNNVNSDLGKIQISANTGNTTLQLGSSIKVSRILGDGSQILNSNGSNTITITGSGNFNGGAGSWPFAINGTFTASTGTVEYVGTSNTDITDQDNHVTYYNLILDPASGSPTYNIGVSDGPARPIIVTNNLTIGNGSNAVTLTGAVTNPPLSVTGSTTIANGATLTTGTGAFNFTGNLTVDGTLNGPSAANTITANGNVTGSGTIDLYSGSVFEQRVASGKNFGSTSGSNDWNFETLKFSNSNGGATPVTITTQSGGSGIIKSYNFAVGGGSDVSGATVTLLGSSRTWQFGGSSHHGATCTNSSILVFNNSGSLTPETSTTNFECGGGSGTLPSSTYYNLGFGTVSDGGSASTLTLGGDTTVQNTLTIGNSGSTNTDTLSLSSFTLTLSGSGTPLSIASKGDLSPSTGTINYTGTSATNITAETYKNLGIGTTADSNAVTYTLAGNVTVSGVLTIGASSGSGTHTLTTGSNTITLSGSGTPYVRNTKGALALSTGTVNYTGTSATNVAAENNYYNLGVGTTSDGTSATYTLAGNVIVSNDLTIGNASDGSNKDTLDASSRTLTLFGSGTANTPFNITAGGIFTPSTSTVRYVGTSNVAAATYNNLQFSNANTYTLPAADITLIGNLTITSGAVITKSASNKLIFAKGGGGTQTISDTSSDLGLIQVSANSGATTLSTSSNIVATKITVDASQNLDISSDTVTLTGTSSPLVLSGSNTFTVTGSTMDFTGNGATGIPATTYNNLGLKPSSSSQQVLGSGTFTVNGTLTVGDATHQGAEASTNNSILNITGATTVTNGATLTQGTGAFNFSGDVTLNSGSTYTDGSGNMVFKKNGTITLTDSNGTKQDLGAVQISDNSGATTLALGSSAKMTSLTIDSSQIFTPGSNTLTLTGTGTPLTVNGTFTSSGSTVSYTGATANLSATTYNSLTLGSGTYTAPSGTMTLTGDLTNNGTFTHNSGTVAIVPANSTASILGSNITFNNLTLSGSDGAGKTLAFKDGNTYTFAGTFTVAGQNGNPLLLSSTSGGSQWTATFSGGRDVDYVLVQDSGCSGGNSVGGTEHIFDKGNNGSCWRFLSFGGGSHGAGTPPSNGGSGGGSPVGGGSGQGGGGNPGGGDGGSGGGTPVGGGGDQGGGTGGGATP